MIELSWFPKELSPNARVHFRKKHKFFQSYKQEAYLKAGNKPDIESYHVKVIFHPPDKRRRDLDNCLAAIKSAFDGIAERWNIDDTLFRPITIDFGDKVKNGKIIISFLK